MKKINKNKVYRLRKGAIIHTRSGYHKCICADKEVAIFAASNKAGTRVKYHKLFATESCYEMFIQDHKKYCWTSSKFEFFLISK